MTRDRFIELCNAIDGNSVAFSPYCVGYRRGLRRGYFGIPERRQWDHIKALTGEDDESIGYQAGFYGEEPQVPPPPPKPVKLTRANFRRMAA